MLILPKHYLGLRRVTAAGGGGITVVGTFENSSNGASTTTVTLSGTAAGQVVYAFQAAAPNSVPSGYTQVASNDINGGVYLKASRKVLTGADTSIVFPSNGFGGVIGSACGAVVLSGVDTTTPEDATGTTSGGTTGQPDGPAITTVTNGALVMTAIFVGDAAADGAYTEPAGYTNKIDLYGNGSTYDGGLGVASILKATAGAENPAAWSGVTFGAPDWVAITIAARPA